MKSYATLKRRFSKTELIRLNFRFEGANLVKRYCQKPIAIAYPDGSNDFFRVTPYAKYWR
jgi:hypothetical protein